MAHPNMPGSAGAYTNAFEVANQLELSGERSIDDVRRVVRHHGLLLKTKIQAGASGRPGPRVVTGDYRRSWSTRFTPNAGGGTARVGTNRPQARRLEYGFVGQDRIGRYYNQPPRPHVGPAVDATQTLLTSAVRDLPTL